MVGLVYSWGQEKGDRKIVEVTDIVVLKIIWYAEIENVLIKQDVEILIKRGYS